MNAAQTAEPRQFNRYPAVIGDTPHAPKRALRSGPRDDTLPQLNPHRPGAANAPSGGTPDPWHRSADMALSRRVSSVLKLLLQAREPAGREPSPSAGDTRLMHRGIGFAHDSLLEEAGFEPLVPPLTAGPRRKRRNSPVVHRPVAAVDKRKRRRFRIGGRKQIEPLARGIAVGKVRMAGVFTPHLGAACRPIGDNRVTLAGTAAELL